QHAFSNDWFLRPLMAGVYPRAYVDQEGALAEMDIRPGDDEAIRAPHDFIGINLYTRTIAANNPDDKYLGIRQVPPPGPKTDFGWEVWPAALYQMIMRDRKSTRLNSSHVKISYAVFCLKKKIKNTYTLSNIDLEKYH